MHQIADNQLSEALDLFTVIHSFWDGMVLLLVGMIGWSVRLWSFITLRLAAAQCIVIGPVCGFVAVCLCVCLLVCYHDNSKFRASIITKLGL